MYLHLGNNTVIRTEMIIGIFDLESSTLSFKTREFLNSCEKNGMVVNVSSELPKSFVLCRENGQNKIYICQLSPITLMKRASQPGKMADEKI